MGYTLAIAIVLVNTNLGIVAGSIILFGIVRDADEGAVAHIQQLLMVRQLPMLAYFVIRWLPRAPRHTLYVLAIQIGVALAALSLFSQSIVVAGFNIVAWVRPLIFGLAPGVLRCA
jgi:hypothetical protein